MWNVHMEVLLLMLLTIDGVWSKSQSLYDHDTGETMENLNLWL